MWRFVCKCKPLLKNSHEIDIESFSDSHSKRQINSIQQRSAIPQNTKVVTTVVRTPVMTPRHYYLNPPALVTTHIPTQIPRTEKKQYPTRNCRYCPGRKETRWECVPCGNIPLHDRVCFEHYHRRLLEK